jgi:hypothetical protein
MCGHFENAEKFNTEITQPLKTLPIHGHSLRLPDMTRHLPASRAATISGVCWGRQLG